MPRIQLWINCNIILNKNTQMIAQIFNGMKDASLSRKIVAQAKKKYNIKSYQLEKMNFKVALEILSTISKKIDSKTSMENPIGQDNPLFFEEKWQQLELRLFIWLLVGYQYLSDRKIDKMQQKEFDIFTTIFADKSRQFLFYKGRLLVNERKAKWEKLEIDLLQKLVRCKKEAEISWNRISLELFFLSDKKYVKSSQKCRQLWFNHLNPSLNKSNWTLAEDIELVDLALKLGTKWAVISKNLNNRRNEHMIKNRFTYLCRTNHIDIRIISSRHVLKQLKKKILGNDLKSANQEKIISLEVEQVQQQLEREMQSEEAQEAQSLNFSLEMQQKEKMVQRQTENQNVILQEILSENFIQQGYHQMRDQEKLDDISQYLNIS